MASVEGISDQLEILNRKIDKAIFEEKKPDEKKPWWATLTQFLALPAIAILMIMQLTQSAANLGTPAKTQAEIEKIRVETVKAQADTQKTLNDLERDARGGVSRKVILESIGDLRTQMDKLAQSQQVARSTSIIEAFVLLMIANMAIGLFLDVIGSAWTTLINGIMSALNATILRYHRKDSEAKQMRRERIRHLMPLIANLISPLFPVFSISVRVSVFVALAIPLFDLVMARNGSNLRFAQLSHELLHGHIGQFLTLAKKAIFAG